MRVPPAHLTYRAHCTVEVSCFLRHAAEHSPKTSTWSGVVTCVAHGHQGSRMRPTTHALVHSVHRNPPPPRPTGERRGHRRRLPPAGAGREEGPPEGPGVHREHRGDHVLRADPAPGTLNGLGLCPAGVAACLSKHAYSKQYTALGSPFKGLGPPFKGLGSPFKGLGSPFQGLGSPFKRLALTI